MEGHDFAERPEPGSGWVHYFLYFHKLASSIFVRGREKRYTMRRIQNATDGELWPLLRYMMRRIQNTIDGELWTSLGQLADAKFQCSSRQYTKVKC